VRFWRVLRVLLLGPFAVLWLALCGVWAILEVSYVDARDAWRNRGGVFRGGVYRRDESQKDQ
jgi:hypothetical protein